MGQNTQRKDIYNHPKKLQEMTKKKHKNIVSSLIIFEHLLSCRISLLAVLFFFSVSKKALTLLIDRNYTPFDFAECL